MYTQAENGVLFSTVTLKIAFNTRICIPEGYGLVIERNSKNKTSLIKHNKKQ